MFYIWCTHISLYLQKNQTLKKLINDENSSHFKCSENINDVTMCFPKLKYNCFS